MPIYMVILNFYCRSFLCLLQSNLDWCYIQQFIMDRRAGNDGFEAGFRVPREIPSEIGLDGRGLYCVVI